VRRGFELTSHGHAVFPDGLLLSHCDLMRLRCAMSIFSIVSANVVAVARASADLDVDQVIRSLEAAIGTAEADTAAGVREAAAHECIGDRVADLEQQGRVVPIRQSFAVVERHSLFLLFVEVWVFHPAQTDLDVGDFVCHCVGEAWCRFTAAMRTETQEVQGDPILVEVERHNASCQQVGNGASM
jgi:hypothetical protein